jgi:deoxyuridine 5'-triphosphate nucleotidohydrolase
VHCPGRLLVQADALTRKWPTHLPDDNIDKILLPNRLFVSKPTLCNRIASVLLASIDTTIDPMPIIDKPVLLVDTTSEQLSRRATPDAAGLDLFANEAILVPAYDRILIQLGIKIALPARIYRQIAPRSSLLVKGINIGAGVIDPNYRGELQVVVINHTGQPFHINVEDRIAQLLVKKIAFPNPIRISNLNETSREIGGFGSTEIANADLGLCKAISQYMSEDTFGKSICRALKNKSVPFPE